MEAGARDDVVELQDVIRRVVAARVRDPDTVQDVVQESLARVLEARPRLEGSALAPYAIVTARNLVASLARSEDRRRRHAHRLVELRDPERPDERALRREEARAVSTALTHLPRRDRAAVVAHELEGTDTATLARELDSTPGGVAVRLARARAKLRVEYLLALRVEEPPTERCRPVLIALSAGDRRRQIALGAGGHLLECSYCAAVSEPLLRRRRVAGGIAAALGLDRLGAWLARSARSTQVQAGAATVAVATAVVAVLGTPAEQPPMRRPLPAGVTTLAGEPVLLRAGAGLERLVGRDLRARDVLVQSVPSDEGFWIGRRDGKRLWVQLRSVGSESRREFEAGLRVSLRGTVVAHGAAFVRRVGVTQQEGAAQLRRQGVHLEVRPGSVSVR